MKKINIVGISPNHHLDILMKKVSTKYSNINFIPIVGDLIDGVNKLYTLKLHDIDVIISRGGTALLMRKHFDIPVVEINISPQDILNTMHLAQNDNNKKVLVAFENITEKALVLRNLLGLDYDIITIDNKESAKEILTRLKSEGFNTVISDTITSKIANDLELNSLLIHSSEDTVRYAFDNAINIGKSQLQNRENAIIFSTINKYNTIKTLVLDENLEFLDKYSSSNISKGLINKIIKYFQSNIMKENEFFQIVINENIFLIKYNFDFYIDKQLHLFFIEKKHYEKKSILPIKEFNLPIDDTKAKKNNTIFFSLISTDFKQRVDYFSSLDEPIFIFGENGTPIQNLVYYFIDHLPTFKKFVVFDINEFTSETWDLVLNSNNSLLLNNDYIFNFKNIHTITEENLKKLKRFINYTNLYSRNRIIFSGFINQKDSNNFLISFLKDHLYIKIPSLNEDISYLHSLITLYLNKFNTLLGKNIIGIEPTALKILTKYKWPQNHNQLENVIKQLVLRSNNAFITFSDTNSVLYTEDFLISNSSIETFEQNKSLEEINYEVIKKTIIEENGNKTKAAQKLQISRSTIWRLLNKFEQ